MAFYTINGKTLTAIADAIRAKTGRTDMISPADFASAIYSITGAGRKVRVEYYKTLLFDTTITESQALDNCELSPDGRYFLRGGSVYDVETGAVAWTILDNEGNAAGAGSKFDYLGSVIGYRKTDSGMDLYRATENSFEVLRSAPSASLVWKLSVSQYDEGICWQTANASDPLNWVWSTELYSDGDWAKVDLGLLATNGFVFTNDGKYFIAYSQDVRKIDRKTRSLIATFVPPGSISNLTLTANNNYVVNTTGGTTIVDGVEVPIPILSVYRISDNQYVFDFNSVVTEQGDGICLPRTNIVFFTSNEGAVRVFDIASGAPVEVEDVPPVQGDLGRLYTVKSNNVGTRVMIVGSDGIEIWNIIEEEQ